MNFARRLFSSSSRVASSVQTEAATAPGVSTSISVLKDTALRSVDLKTKARILSIDEVPKPIRNHVRRDLERATTDAIKRAAKRNEEWDGKVQVQNPFLNFWRPATTADAKGSMLWTAAAFNRRQQKQLLKQYPADLLPPSTANPIRRPALIKWEDGTIISWRGTWKRKTETSLYASRRIQANGTYFKGTKAERNAPAKKAEREERMADMPARIAEFRKNSKNTVVGRRKLVPF